MYKLTKQHIACAIRNPAPVLLSHDTCLGPYTKNTTLPWARNSVASDFVSRHLMNELRPDDPALEVDPGANKVSYCREYLIDRMLPEDIAKFDRRLKMKGIKIPEPLEGGISARAEVQPTPLAMFQAQTNLLRLPPTFRKMF